MSNEMRVLYNADCPICDAEICHYRSYTEKRDIPVAYDDLNSDALAQWGIDPETAAKRLHVTANGELYSGIPAFLILWQEMPRFRWLARLIGLPGIKQLACLAYDHALAPCLYRKHLRRQAKAQAS